MNRILADADTPISERDAAWFEELADAVDRGRAGMIARPGDSYWLRLLVAPVCDTALSLISLVEARQPGDSFECEAAVRRLLKPARSPDASETATALVALRRSGHAVREACGATVHDGINRLLESQNRDGGWAASVGDGRRNPSCPAVTARVLEALGCFGFRPGQPPVDDAMEFIFARQEESGAWLALGGGNALSTTWQVLAGLHAAGFDMTAIVVRRAVRWLKESQNADGGWGESEKSAVPPTAWAMLGLLATGEAGSAEVRAGAEFLVGTQRADGAWTGASHFPLMALARYASAVLPVQNGGSRTGYRLDSGHPAPVPKEAGIHAPTDS